MAVKTCEKLSLVETKKLVTVRFINDILGSAPSSRQIYERYLLTKLDKEITKIEKKLEKVIDSKEREILLKKKKDLENQLADLPEIEEADSKLTVFYRADWVGNGGVFKVPVIRAHQVLGFFKEAANNFKDVIGIKNARDKVSKYVRIHPYNIFIYDTEISPENLVDDIDGILERPLKAMTMQGPRVSIAASEVIKSEDRSKLIRFEVILYKNKEITWDVLETLLEYGRDNGISQWRTAGYGAFEVVSIE